MTRLNGAEIHARFQQVRGESVPQGVGVDGLIFAAANPDRVPGAVDIAHVEVSQFGDPGSGGIHRG